MSFRGKNGVYRHPFATEFVWIVWLVDGVVGGLVDGLIDTGLIVGVVGVGDGLGGLQVVGVAGSNVVANLLAIEAFASSPAYILRKFDLLHSYFSAAWRRRDAL